GFEGSGTTQLCMMHAAVGMVRIKPRRRSCEVCLRSPSSPLRSGGDRTMGLCWKHTPDGMRYVGSRICTLEGYTRGPSSESDRSENAELSGHDGREGTEDWHRKGCMQQPLSGSEYDRRVEPIANHDDEGLTGQKHKKCCYEGCSHQPLFGLKGTGRPLFCTEHARAGMVRAVTRPSCSHRGCSSRPSFGVEGSGRADFCPRHAHEG
ncbi:unnamed protein product, partial [Sphacelaria rigidula]